MSFQNICTFISRSCLIYQVSKHRRLIFCWEKLDHLVMRKLRVCVCVCVGRELHVTIFYSPQAPMKRVWNPLLPQIDIREQCQSLCKRQINFENLPEPTLGFDNRTRLYTIIVIKTITWCRGQFRMLFIFYVGQVKTVQLRGEWLSQWRCHTTDFF